MIRAGALAAVLVGCLAGSARAADRVELKSGTVVQGTIEVVTDTKVVLRVGDEVREIPRSLVASVVRDTAAPADAAKTPPAPERTAGAAQKTEQPSAPAAEQPAPQVAAGQTPAAQRTPPAKQSATVPAVPADAEPKEPAVADTSLAKALGSGDPAKAEAAAQTIITGWPATLPSLKVALASPSPECRREAILVVHRGALQGAEGLIVKAATDAEASVRLLAIRAMRGARYAEHEPLLVTLLSTDAELGVRHECLRTLEVIGTVKCLPAVLESFAKTEAPDTRRRHLRVLKTITGKDAKDDVEAWREIIRAADLESHLKK